jgi:hypothetical protein
MFEPDKDATTMVGHKNNLTNLQILEINGRQQFITSFIYQHAYIALTSVKKPK